MFSGDTEAKVKFTSSWSFTRDQPAEAQTTSGSIVKEMTLTSFKPFIDLILNQETPSRSDSSKGSQGEHSASIRVNSLFPKLLKLSSAASTAPLEVLSKDDPEHG